MNKELLKKAFEAGAENKQDFEEWYKLNVFNKQKKSLSISDITILSENDEDGKKIIELFVNNGVKNIWHHDGSYRKHYYAGWTDHIKAYSIYTFNFEDSIKRFGKIKLALSELENYNILSVYE